MVNTNTERQQIDVAVVKNCFYDTFKISLVNNYEYTHPSAIALNPLAYTDACQGF